MSISFPHPPQRTTGKSQSSPTSLESLNMFIINTRVMPPQLYQGHCPQEVTGQCIRSCDSHRTNQPPGRRLGHSAHRLTERTSILDIQRPGLSPNLYFQPGVPITILKWVLQKMIEMIWRNS